MTEAPPHLVTKAQHTIHKILYLTLATSDKKNQPWNSPVIYKFSPEHIWVNADGSVAGNYVDKRVEITQELFKKRA